MSSTGSTPFSRATRAALHVFLSVAMIASVSSLGLVTAQAAVAPAGNGFTVTASDLAFILKQIQIAEYHVANTTPATGPCGALVGPGAHQVPDRLTSYGLRTVDGSCNNLFPARHRFAAADEPFPRLTNPVFRDAEAAPPLFGGGPQTDYRQKVNGNVVFDSQPRTISNLIVDQTSTNPAAVAAAGFPVRAQNGGNPTVACATDANGDDIQPLTPANCVPRFHTLFIENVTTDVGLSPPYNSLFTFFGQFFDHGVDQTVKGGGTVIVPLKDDDPLVAGPDHVFGNADDLPPPLRFIPLTRGQNQPGPDGIIGTDDDIQDANNTDTPLVDQSQTYTSHPAHQAFLREYEMVPCAQNPAGCPMSTGRLLGGLPANGTYPGSPDGTTGISTWASTKRQAEQKLGLQLVDPDVFNIPMIAADTYGNFIPGLNGLPQWVTTGADGDPSTIDAGTFVEGNLANPVPAPANVAHFDTPFLTDIAHNAEPKPGLTRDPDLVPSADFANQLAGTYDNEMLDAHFTCGDGRCNENIALSTIHQIFHSEHDRLADEFDTTTLPANPGLSANYHATNCAIGCATNDSTLPTTFTYGERLFQAARFVTEMEYQHLVFEEFARKLAPGIRPFHVYHPDVNPVIPAEFAHAVYRFGHSMLDDDVARTTDSSLTGGAKADNSLPLLDAFLNPPEYFNAHGTIPNQPFYTPEQAAGAVIMGSADQAGNELDEFINNTLRNNLLGLPLDLATFNLTRARSEGVPPLNDVRRQIFAQTNDGQMAPYTSWSDYGQHLKHPESLINFVAAYGLHDTITRETTYLGKRAAARMIVDPKVTDPACDANLQPAPCVPADASDFMFSTGAWATPDTGPNAGVTTTGLDSVDLWVGGLAEITNLFGGLLGSTFNYVFQGALENLQDGDRFYYLFRTPGMNLRAQLEGDSFAELFQRNTDGTNTLKADAFATADCKFQLANLAGTPDGFAAFGATVNDDPSTPDCDESLLLLRKPDGTIQYRQFNTVDPAGINGQAVYNGTPGIDHVFGGNDNDTFWGAAAGDIIEGNGGDDVVLGGDGNDIVSDLSGADVLKGGADNDALDAGINDDINIGGDGQDFTNGGANDNETFAGPGNDFIIAGQGADAVFGDGGDDWIEGGSGQDLLQGDHGAPFFDDPAQTAPGNEIFIGQVGENDYDAEGGDDLMSQNAAIDRNAGAAGFDWAFHQFDTVGADDDMLINQQLFGLPIQVVVNRDRWGETEADSGSNFNDILRGDSMERVTGPAGFSGCDALDQAGVDRIAGLNKLVTTFPSLLQPVIDASINGFCPLTGSGPGGDSVWAEGNILLGGGGSDLIEGRGNNDIIDGDHALSVRISVRTNPANPASEIGSTDLMEHKALTGTFGAGTAGKTLQQAVFAGQVDPGSLVAVREITGMGATPDNTPAAGLRGDCETAVAPVNCDVSLYDAGPENYTFVRNANGSVTVTDITGDGTLFSKGDGIDTLWNIERVRFCVGTDPVSKNCNDFREFFLDSLTVPAGPTTGTGTVTIDIVAPTEGDVLTASLTDPGLDLGSDTISWERSTDVAGTWVPVGSGTTFTPGNPEVGRSLRAVASYTVGGNAATATSTSTAPVINVNDPPTGAATIPVAASVGSPVSVDTTTIDDADGIPGFTYQWQSRTAVTPFAPIGINSPSYTPVAADVGSRLRVIVSWTDNHGTAERLISNRTRPITAVTTVPGAPVIGTATAGPAGGALTATVTWTPPASTGGSRILNYRATADPVGPGANIVGPLRPASARQQRFTLPAGNYRFFVVAINAIGTSSPSALSNQVAPA